MISAELAREFFRYDPETGNIYWLVKRWRRRPGDIAGWRPKNGAAMVVGILGETILAHRLAWLLVTGKLPEKEIDHRDGNPANNRWNNLRLADRLENAKNRKLNANNKSGFKGVSRHQNKWVAYIASDRKPKYLGIYDTPEAAHKAYVNAAKKLHGEFARVG